MNTSLKGQVPLNLNFSLPFLFFILGRVVIAGEGSSRLGRLGVLLSLPPLSLVDMLQATYGGFST
jgi:hypothetical protein